MRHLFFLAGHSAWNRRLTLGLTMLAIGLSVSLLIGVERLRNEAREGFDHSVSGTDLVIGARTSPVQLMLYAVFHIGEATTNIRWNAYQEVVANPLVAWSVPLSLGDSVHGFPVLGTTADYFEHFRYGDDQPLAIASGKLFSSTFDAVLGSEVAAHLGYRLGDHITLSHGMGTGELSEHADKPFVVCGTLAPTGTPVDRTVHVSLEAISAIHLDWVGGAPTPGFSIPQKYVHKFDLAPKEITAALVGLKSRATVFRMQRMVNDFRGEPLLAVMPGVALQQLWQVLDVAERSLLAVSAMVVVVGLSGLVAVILAGLNERRRELAILRAVGAGAYEILLLLTFEGLLVTVAGIVSGLVWLAALTLLLAPMVQATYGIVLLPRFITLEELKLLALVLAVGLVASLVPGYRAYKLSLSDGLTPRT